MGLTVTIGSNAEGLLRKIRRIRDEVERGDHPILHEGLTAAATVYDTYIWQRVVNQAATDWPPLRPKYLAWKINKGYDPRMGIMTGAMLASLLPGGPNNVLELHPWHATVGSNDRKIVWFNNGTSRNGKQCMPARPIYVEPDGPTQQAMSETLGQAFGRFIDSVRGA